jgi:hypothetical protein
MPGDEHRTPQSDRLDILNLLWSADPRNKVPEEKRIAAASRLLDLFRSQYAERLNGREVDSDLHHGLIKIAFRIFIEPDPVYALELFLGRKRRQGKRAANAERDLSITMSVIKLVRGEGLTLDDAYADHRIKPTLSSDRIKAIYKANHKAAKAIMAFESEPDEAK